MLSSAPFFMRFAPGKSSKHSAQIVLYKGRALHFVLRLMGFVLSALVEQRLVSRAYLTKIDRMCRIVKATKGQLSQV
jgi:hypothetical protein